MSARLTPYEIAFGPARFEAEIFPRLREQSEMQGVDAAVPEAVWQLPAAADVLRDLQPDAADIGQQPAGAVRSYALLLFQAFRFHEAGRPLYVAGEPRIRQLLAEREPIGEWTFAPPAPAGYLELPRHLIWARVAEGLPPEPLDGFFWSVGSARDAARLERLDLLLVLGVRADRPGFSVAEIAAPLPAPPPGHWGDAPARDDGEDFANILPGGELRDLLGIVTPAEVLRMITRLFEYLNVRGDAALEPAATAAPAAEAAGAYDVPPSALPARIITLPPASE